MGSLIGKEFDATGPYHSNARYYDPLTGRFLTEDPVRQGVNWYAYCGNNPVNRTDPTGRREIESDNNGRLTYVSSSGSLYGGPQNTPSRQSSPSSPSTPTQPTTLPKQVAGWLLGNVLNPIRDWLDRTLPTGTLGLGWGAAAGAGAGVDVGAGIVVGHGRGSGFQAGVYGYAGGGGYGGASASVMGEVSCSANPDISNLRGPTIEAGASAGPVDPPIGAGFATNLSRTANPLFTAGVGLSAGTPFETHGYANYTEVVTVVKF